MGLHAYCIARAALAPSGHGVDGAAVECVRDGDVALWVSRHGTRPAATLASVRAHDAVIRSAMDERHTPVPLRFGQWSEDEAGFQRRLAEQREHWLELLAAFAGAVEFGLRLASPVPIPVAQSNLVEASSGTEYMERLAERAKRRQALEAEQQHALEAVRRHTAEHVLREASGDVPDGAGLLWVAHLVRRDRVAWYRDATRALEQAEPQYAVRLTGPWPPYSFVT